MKKHKQATEAEQGRSEVLRAPSTKFLADESIEAGSVRVLKRFLGCNIKTIADLGMVGRSDEAVIAAARKLKRVLLTHDRDFLDDKRFPLSSTPGVIYWPPYCGNTEAFLFNLIRTLRLFRKGADLWMHTKVVIDMNGSVVVRTWEKDEGQIIVSRYRLGESGLRLLSQGRA